MTRGTATGIGTIGTGTDGITDTGIIRGIIHGMTPGATLGIITDITAIGIMARDLTITTIITDTIPGIGPGGVMVSL